MLQAGARFCKCLGSEFLPYLPMVMPQLLQSASLSPDVSVREQDDEGEDIEEEDEDDDDVSRALQDAFGTSHASNAAPLQTIQQTPCELAATSLSQQYPPSLIYVGIIQTLARPKNR